VDECSNTLPNYKMTKSSSYQRKREVNVENKIRGLLEIKRMQNSIENDATSIAYILKGHQS